MIDVNVDRGSSMPLHDQVAAEIRRAIANGEAKPGERLPASVDLAAVLGVNRNTVLRALRILRDEGIVDFKRGLTVRVTGTPQKSAVLQRSAELLAFARRQGYRKHELLELIDGLP